MGYPTHIGKRVPGPRFPKNSTGATGASAKTFYQKTGGKQREARSLPTARPSALRISEETRYDFGGVAAADGAGVAPGFAGGVVGGCLVKTNVSSFIVTSVHPCANSTFSPAAVRSASFCW
jgi:hypothetical protein